MRNPGGEENHNTTSYYLTLWVFLLNAKITAKGVKKFSKLCELFRISD